MTTSSYRCPTHDYVPRRRQPSQANAISTSNGKSGSGRADKLAIVHPPPPLAPAVEPDGSDTGGGVPGFATDAADNGTAMPPDGMFEEICRVAWR